MDKVGFQLKRLCSV